MNIKLYLTIAVLIAMAIPVIAGPCVYCNTGTVPLDSCSCLNVPVCTNTSATSSCHWNVEVIRIDCDCPDPNTEAWLMAHTCYTGTECVGS